MPQKLGWHHHSEMDRLLYTEFFQNRQEGTYFEAGCDSSGVTLYFSQSLKWRGICVQPTKRWNLLNKRIRNHNRTVFVQNGLWEREQTLHLINFPGLEGRTRVTESFEIGEELTKFRGTPQVVNRQNVYGKELEINATTIQTLLDANHVKHIEILQLDLENCELEALRGVDFTRTSVDVVVLETGCCKYSYATFMARLGFVFVGKCSNGWDSAFVHHRFLCRQIRCSVTPNITLRNLTYDDTFWRRKWMVKHRVKNELHDGRSANGG